MYLELFFMYFLLMAASFILSYKEGMIMIQPGDPGDFNKDNDVGGIKEHRDYNKIYHCMNVTGCMAIVIAGGLIGYCHLWNLLDCNIIKYITMFLGTYFLLNEVAEVAYSCARFLVTIPEYENFIFLELYSNRIEGRDQVKQLHINRITAVIVLLLVTFI